MGQWSEPKKEISRYGTESGGVVTVTRTFVDHLSDQPGSGIDHKALVNIEISGDISEEHATKLWEWITDGYPRPIPEFFRRFHPL